MKTGSTKKTGRLSQQPLNRKSSQPVRLRLSTSPSNNTKWKTKEKYHARLPAQVSASSVSKGSRWQRKTGAKGRSVRPGRRETSRRQPRECNRAQGEKKEVKTVQSSATCRGKKAMVPGKVRTHCSIVCMVKRREGLGVQRLADLANLPHAGSRGLRA